MPRMRLSTPASSARSRAEDLEGRLLRRIVRARDEERRRIERDLHDGAQQEVLAVMVGLDLAAERAEGDPELQRRLIALREQLDGALKRIRDLARGVFPPLLDQEGIGAAVEAMAQRWDPRPAVACRDLGRYDVEVETAVFFACAEGLQNAARHAGAGATIEIEVAEHDGAIAFEVRDDGAGIELDRLRPGRGLRNVAERLEAVGGALEISSAPGQGTAVTGMVPVARADGPPPGAGEAFPGG